VHQKGYCVGAICENFLKFSILLLSKILISTYLNQLKLNLNMMFALNFGIIYIFELLVLVESMKNDERSKVIVYKLKNIMHKMFKFSLENYINKHLILNHRSNDEDHV
jgi:hypothetical protein